MFFVFVCVRQRDRFRGHLFSITTKLSSDWLKSCKSVIRSVIRSIIRSVIRS